MTEKDGLNDFKKEALSVRNFIASYYLYEIECPIIWKDHVKV